MIKVEGKGGIYAKVIADSVSEKGKRIVSFELNYQRFIHSEFMTHRQFSRNAASSRAIPVDKVIDQVHNEPAIPIHWGKNKSGMQASEEVESIKFAKASWLKGAEHAASDAHYLKEAGLHKQIVNRILEPYQMIKVVCTATEYDNFFYLRDHEDAQPEIAALAKCMREAMNQSVPVSLRTGEWHLPYLTGPHDLKGTTVYDSGDRLLSLPHAIMVSSSLCAQVSYRKSDDSLEKALNVYSKLVNMKPMHCYDDKTEVLTASGFKMWKDIDETDLLASVDSEDGKFIGFTKPKELIKEYYEGKMYLYNQRDFSLCVTPNHKLYAQRVRKYKDRVFVKADLFEACSPNSNKAKYSTAGESNFLNPLTTKGVKNSNPGQSDFYMGCLHGFFVGDGFIPRAGSKSILRFRLKKSRKVYYLRTICEVLGLEYEDRVDKNGITNISVKSENLGAIFDKELYTKDRDKKLPEDFASKSDIYLMGLFDGLSNSDGSVKRDTVVYSTSSPTLAKQFEILCTIGGFGSCFVSVVSKEGCKPNYRLMVRTSKVARVNDSRRRDDKVKIIDYKGYVYCATVEGNVLIVRREGNVCLSGNSSPFEHQATPMPEVELFWPKGVTHKDKDNNYWSGNFMGWIQNRQLIDNPVYKGSK